jgi:hypothetical protein
MESRFSIMNRLNDVALNPSCCRDLLLLTLLARLDAFDVSVSLV